MHKKIREAIIEEIFGHTEAMSYDKAHKWVISMQPYGEKWSINETTSHLSDSTIDKNEWYAVMNMMWNDYHDAVPENVETFKKLSLAWFRDVDAPPHKTCLYYKYIIEESL